MYLSIGLIFILSSTLLVHMVLYATEYTWVSKHSKDTLLATGVSSSKIHQGICLISIYFSLDNWLHLRLGGAPLVGHRLLALVAVSPGARRCQRTVYRRSRNDADEPHQQHRSPATARHWPQSDALSAQQPDQWQCNGARCIQPTTTTTIVL